MESSLPNFCFRVREEIRGGNLNSALTLVIRLVTDITLHQSSVGRVLASPELDQLCTLVGAVAREETGPAAIDRNEARENTVVYLVTELAKSGGHSRLLSDLIAAENAGEQIVLVSNLHETTVMSDIIGPFAQAGAVIRIAPQGDYSARLRWIQHELARIRPRQSYVIPHHFDAVIMAAAQPDLVGKLIYIHNCDHALALGVHLSHARHVDFHAKNFYHCREHEGVASNVIWPLVAADHGHRVDTPFLTRGHLTTCTSGGFEKFEFWHGFEQVPYLHRYEDVVPIILHASRGTHIHIGALRDVMLDRIRAGLASAGLAADRFVYIPYVASLWTALLEHNVDVYIGSFPYGGGRAVVEAMGAGLPLVVHSNYRSHFFSDIDVYDGAMIWRHPAELKAFLLQLDLLQLTEHARRSRVFYSEHHRPELLRAAIALEAGGGEPPLPARPVHLADCLQSYFDDRHACWTESGRRVVVTDQEMNAWAEEAQARLERAIADRDATWRVEIEKARQGTVRETQSALERESLGRGDGNHDS
jgi:hypothetical protein